MASTSADNDLLAANSNRSQDSSRLSPNGGHFALRDNPCLGYITSGLVFFILVNYCTRWTIPKAVRETKRQDPQEVKWKWRNVLTSFIHSSITGVWAPFAFAMEPSLGSDMINAYSTSAHALISISIGYFIYDFADMALYHRKQSTFELLIHHGMVILCFGIAVSTRTYVAYGALSLVVEINSIFLHARQLLNILEVSKSSWIYRTNAILNVATFVLFRILLLGWMTRWLTIHRDDVPIIFFTVGSLGLATIVGMNIVLFYRILVGDYLGSKKKTRGTEAVTEDKTEEGGNEAKPSVEFTDCTSLPSSAHRRRQPHHLTKDVNRIVDGALRLVE